jgi:hypothetical protein
MNSRAYLFIFPLNVPADIPGDFRASVEGRLFERGVFLPQADTDWFTQTPEYPARLLLLKGCCLYIIPHPTSGQEIVELNLADLVQLETGSSLLSGWIRFTTGVSTLELTYNTRASNRLDEFIATVRRRWLGAPAAVKLSEIKRFGAELDIKFRNLLEDALDGDEFVLSQCFAPPLTYRGRCILFRKNQWRPGHVVVLTSGNRLLWLKDDYRGHWERYAGIAVSAPLSVFRGCSVETASDHHIFAVTFTVGNPWQIEIHQSASAWDAFSQTLMRPEPIPDQQSEPSTGEPQNYTQSDVKKSDCLCTVAEACQSFPFET